MNMAVLSDSIALLTGTKGVLLRWNYKNTVFTGIGENYLESLGIRIFPNPVKDKLRFQFENNLTDKFKLNISNTLGQTIYSKNEIDLKEEIDVSFLEQGIYFIKLESEKNSRVFKVAKE